MTNREHSTSAESVEDYSKRFPETREAVKRKARYLSNHALFLSACDEMPPELRERTRIAADLLSSVWVRLDDEQEIAA